MIEHQRELPTLGTPITTFAGLHEGPYGARLARIPALAAAFRAEFAGTGTPDSVATYDLVTLPYPTSFGLWRASKALAPFVSITNRMLVIRWTESDGRRRTLLFEPSDVERGENTPYFAALAARTPKPLQKLMVRRHGDVPGRLAEAGIDPSDVDYLVFDHLHTQDVRRWLGTTTGEPAFFPRAKLVVQRHELAAMASLHPLQKPWYQPDTYADLPPERIVAIDGDTLLGPGVALLATPGHVLGNQTLLLNTGTGIWASSENAIAAECLAPEHSRIAGIAGWSRRWQQDVVLNANTIETTAEQYNSLILEKHLVDPAQGDPRFGQFFPSSELTRNVLNPGTAPTFTHRAITHCG